MFLLILVLIMLSFFQVNAVAVNVIYDPDIIDYSPNTILIDNNSTRNSKRIFRLGDINDDGYHDIFLSGFGEVYLGSPNGLISSNIHINTFVDDILIGSDGTFIIMSGSSLSHYDYACQITGIGHDPTNCSLNLINTFFGSDLTDGSRQILVNNILSYGSFNNYQSDTFLVSNYDRLNGEDVYYGLFDINTNSFLESAQYYEIIENDSFGDIDGDGYLDIVYISRDSSINIGYNFLNIGFIESQINTTFLIEGNSHFMPVIDTNGDSYDDIVLRGKFMQPSPSRDEYSSMPTGAPLVVYTGSSDGISNIPTYDIGIVPNAKEFGDFNSDGFLDVLSNHYVEHCDTSRPSEGWVDIHFGSNSGIRESLQIEFRSPLNLILPSHDPCIEDKYGYETGFIGDVNGDGYDDIYITAPEVSSYAPSSIYIYHGRNIILGEKDTDYDGVLDNLDNCLYTYNPDQDDTDSNNIGNACDPMSDVDMDSIVNNLDNCKYIYNPEQVDTDQNGTGDSCSPTTVDFDATLNHAGTSKTAGDINGDGYDDVMVAVDNITNSYNGSVHIYLGSANGISQYASLVLSPDYFQENNGRIDFGLDIASAGDLNNDGYDDIAVLCYKCSNDYFDETEYLYIYLGHEDGLVNIQRPIIIGGYRHKTITKAGDVNGDGYDDLLAGNYSFNGSLGLNEGIAYLYFGSQDGLSNYPVVLNSHQQSSHYGYDVTTAGDINNDGFDDFLVSAPYESINHPYEGAVYLYYGTSNINNVTTFRKLSTNQANTFFGTSITSGNFNNDIYNDVAILCPSCEHGQIGETIIFIYEGSENGLTEYPSNYLETNSSLTNIHMTNILSLDINNNNNDDLLITHRVDNSNIESYLFYGPFEYAMVAPDIYFQDLVEPNTTHRSNPSSSSNDINGDGFSDLINYPGYIKYGYDTDLDSDNIYDSIDNCPNIYNPEQADIDNNGIGDSCDINDTESGDSIVEDNVSDDSGQDNESDSESNNNINQNNGGGGSLSLHILFVILIIILNKLKFTEIFQRIYHNDYSYKLPFISLVIIVVSIPLTPFTSQL